MTAEEEALVVDLAAQAVLRNDDRALKIAVAKLLGFDTSVPLHLVYAVAARVRDSYAPLNVTFSTNGEHDA